MSRDPGGTARMRDQHPTFSERYLDPGDRLGELLFGLIMALSFTLGAGLIVDEGDDATRQMLIGIIGCNVAWGIVDGVMYAMSCMFERSRKARLLQLLQNVPDDQDAIALVARELDDRLAPLASAQERQALYHEIAIRLRKLPPERTRIERDDVYGAIASFWLVAATAIPAVVPFLFIDDRFVAQRTSNALLIALLFVTGYRWARYTNANPWAFGSTLLIGGSLLVALVIALGG